MDEKKIDKCIPFKRTKIVCTLGPATDDENILRDMIKGGMNVARLNLSHGKLEDHFKRFDMVRKLSEELGEYVAVMLDTRGPDVRTGGLETESATLVAGNHIKLVAEKIKGNAERVSVTFPGLLSILNPGDHVYLHDGLMEIEVIGRDSEGMNCRIINGGILKEYKGVNIPGKSMPLPPLTEDDIHDLKEGAQRGIDYISASFINKPEDIAFIKRVMKEQSGHEVPVIAKIESAEGVSNLEKIIGASDGVMVARGDLGIEIPPEEVPGVQKRMIRLCRAARKPVITATEMLESMTYASRPTRAEIADVANAVLDGTSAVMLSGETAVGKYPVETVRMMARICCRAEKDLPSDTRTHTLGFHEGSVRTGIAHAACYLAHDINAPAIICVTDSGATAAIFSHLRPRSPVLACTPDIKVARWLAVYWGVLPVIVDEKESVQELLKFAVEIGKQKGFIKNGDNIVFTGNLSGRGGDTNLLASVRIDE